jgi:hypothetical protein
MGFLDKIFTSGAQKTYLKRIEELKSRLLNKNYQNLSLEAVYFIGHVNWITNKAKESIYRHKELKKMKAADQAALNNFIVWYCNTIESELSSGDYEGYNGVGLSPEGRSLRKLWLVSIDLAVEFGEVTIQEAEELKK